MVGLQLPAAHPILETLWNAKLLHNRLKRCCVIGCSSVHRNNAWDNPGAFPGCAAACRMTVLRRLCPESGRGFVAARNFNQSAHPSCSQFLPATVGWPGSLGRGWAILKAGFTFALAEKLFMFNSITRQAHGLFQKSSAHGSRAAFPPAKLQRRRMRQTCQQAATN
jgi:hypothetical protein